MVSTLEVSKDLQNEYTLESIPMPSNDRPRRIPRPMDLILIPLQADQPPTRRTHTKKCHYATQDHTQHGISQATARDHHTQPSGREHNQKDCQREVQWPGVVLEMATEHWKEAEDFYAE